jgi:osmotically-inducible protein OsmY
MRWLLGLVRAVALTVSAVAQKAPVTDDQLVDQVRVKLTQDPDVNGGALNVTVKDFVVTLRGELRTDKAKKKAEKIAGKVKGVKKVVNEIVLNPTAL